MFIKDYQRAIPYLIQAGVTPMVLGPHGIGKSMVVRKLCEQNNWHFVDLRLGNFSDAGDLLGLPDFEKDEKGNNVSTKFMTPDWLAEAIKFCEQNPTSYAILHMDEINRTRKDLMAPVFQIALDRQLHTIKFPKNLIPIASANPNTEDYNVTDFSDAAFIDRFAFIKLTPSAKEWLNFADNEKYDSSITGFIQDQPSMLEVKGQDFNLDFVKPSRRSWDFVNKLLKVGTPSELLQELCYGIVGVATTAAYFESLKNSDKPITGEEILKSYKKHKDKVVKWANPQSGRMDTVKASCDSLVKFIQERGKNNTATNQKEFNNLLQFLKDIPLEYSFSATQDLYLEDGIRDYFKEDDELFVKFEKAREIGEVKPKE